MSRTLNHHTAPVNHKQLGRTRYIATDFDVGL